MVVCAANKHVICVDEKGVEINVNQFRHKIFLESKHGSLDWKFVQNGKKDFY